MFEYSAGVAMQAFLALLVSIVLRSHALRLLSNSDRSPEGSEQRWDTYDFQDEWKDFNFEERWSAFSTFVPTSLLQSFWDRDLDVGPVCYPTLVGPEDSEKLAILLHGFLACPGMWYRVVPRLIEAGYRVMLPTLPGHGRAPKDLGGGKFEDELTSMPTSSHEYLAFSNALGLLARQFKKEHPHGEVVVAGHSLGGAITASYALDNLDVVDRVMLLNPMLGLSWKMIKSIANWAPNYVTSKGSSCEKKRAYSSGGTCQFQLQTVTAMVEFAYALTCCKWGLSGACDSKPPSTDGMLDNMTADLASIPYASIPDVRGDGSEEDLKNAACHVHGVPRTGTSESLQRDKFSRLKGFQVVTSKRENLVDNDMIWRFANAVESQRINGGFDLCFWPSELGHSYLSNRPEPGGSTKTKWWHPYVANAVTDFLGSGKKVDVLTVGTMSNACLNGQTDLEGGKLTVLPAVQHSSKYEIAGFEEVIVAFNKPVVRSEKYPFNLGAASKEEFEFILLDASSETYVMTTRPHRNANLKEVLYVDPNGVVIPRKGETDCVRLEYRSFSPRKPLVRKFLDVNSSTEARYFCAAGFTSVVCKRLRCKSKAEWDRMMGNADAANFDALKYALGMV